MKKIIFTSLLFLAGCDTPATGLSIKVAEVYCAENGGIVWVEGYNGYNGKVYRFRCKNGLQSDYQEMKEETKK